MNPSGDHPLFKALRGAKTGQLTLTTPDGAQRVFGNPATGVSASWKVHDIGVLAESIARGEIGFSESYIEGRWETDNLTDLLTFMLANNSALEKFFHGKPWYWLWLKLSHLLSPNSKRRSRKNVQVHYDLGNDFYALWLDESMTYSCGLFGGDKTLGLEDAQKAKYQRILQKLDAKPGDTILEIGCGWGGFAEMAARQGLSVVGITLSTEQAAFAKERMQKAGFEKQVEIRLQDYRETPGTFDHIVSIGMFEHVGKAYWPAYFEIIQRLLKPGGKAMVQTITLDDTLFEQLGNTTGFIEKYIFPGGMLPSKRRFRETALASHLDVNELFAFGKDYAITLQNWLDRFEAKLNDVKALGYDMRFIRIWRFYLSCCIASFVSERTDVMQVELLQKSSI